MDAGQLSPQDCEKYRNASITNIHRGKGHRFNIVYAHIVDAQGSLLVSATLDYCVDRMNDVTKHLTN